MAKEYIEREKALNDDRWNSVILSHDRERAREIILCQPTADVVEVVHGRWEHLGGDEWCCTNCGEVVHTEGSWEKPTDKHCHECGAKMDGERVALEEVVDIDAQTQRNNAAMRRVIDFAMDGGAENA